MQDSFLFHANTGPGWLSLFLVLGLAAQAALAEESSLAWKDFMEMRDLDPSMKAARFCGLDDRCMSLWQSGVMKVTCHSIVAKGDFDGDGTEDTCIALEKDLPAKTNATSAEPQSEAFILFASPQKEGGYKLMQTVPLAGATTVVGTFWDQDRKQLKVDVGERKKTTRSFIRMQGTSLVNSYDQSSEEQILWRRIAWNPETHKLELLKKDKKQK